MCRGYHTYHVQVHAYHICLERRSSRDHEDPGVPLIKEHFHEQVPHDVLDETQTLGQSYQSPPIATYADTPISPFQNEHRSGKRWHCFVRYAKIEIRLIGNSSQDVVHTEIGMSQYLVQQTRRRYAGPARLHTYSYKGRMSTFVEMSGVCKISDSLAGQRPRIFRPSASPLTYAPLVLALEHGKRHDSM